MAEGAENKRGAASGTEKPEFRRAHLATLFLQAGRPLATTELIDQVYNNPTNLELGKKRLSKDSARKALRRDIDALKSTGLIIEPAGKDDAGWNLWRVNRDLSFTQGIALSEEDAVFLDIACLPLLNDPGFPERDELRLALAKIDRLFDANATDVLTASSVRDSAVLVTVREALNARVALEITYAPRSGIATTRRVAPLAFFDVRSTLYVVCALVDVNGNLLPKSERTYRIDRIDDVRRIDSISFEIPADFDVNSFRKLPFQIGEGSIPCTFSVPGWATGTIMAAAWGKGSFTSTDDDCTIWEIDAADVDAAAAWAIAYGIRPLAPEELVRSWKARLEEAAHV